MKIIGWVLVTILIVWLLYHEWICEGRGEKMDLTLQSEEVGCHARRLYDLHEFECNQRVRWRSVAMAGLIVGIIVASMERVPEWASMSSVWKILLICFMTTAIWVVWNRISSYHSAMRDHERAALDSFLFIHGHRYPTRPPPTRLG